MNLKLWPFSNKQTLGVFLDGGELLWSRPGGVETRVAIDNLRQVFVFTQQSQVVWFIEDNDENYAVIPEHTFGMSAVRRYLSNWRGFNYDALLRYELGGEATQLWPLIELRQRA